MTTKFKTLAVVLAVSFGAALSSCQKEEDPTFAKPVVDLKELGYNNSQEVDLGDELHIEADIVAEGRIAKVIVELHNEDVPSEEIEEEFTGNMVGLKNAEFHDHIMVPANFTAGDYHFDLTVIDQEGQSTAIEREVTVK